MGWFRGRKTRQENEEWDEKAWEEAATEVLNQVYKLHMFDGWQYCEACQMEMPPGHFPHASTAYGPAWRSCRRCGYQMPPEHFPHE